MDQYSIELPVKPLGTLYVVDDRAEGGYKPHVKEFLVCHYIVLADHTMAVNEYGHKVTLKLLDKLVFVKKEDAVGRLKEIIKANK